VKGTLEKKLRQDR